MTIRADRVSDLVPVAHVADVDRVGVIPN